MSTALALHDWSALDEPARAALLRRPASGNADEVGRDAAAIVAAVRADGDEALRRFAARFDNAALGAIRVSDDELSLAREAVPATVRAAIRAAIDNVRRFHKALVPQAARVETQPGVVCERLIRPIDAVGLYVPAGTAPLPSAAIMLGVPATLAGCPTVVLATPPRADGSADPTVLAVAGELGIDCVIKAGGAQAVAALAYGTASVPKVAKIFGPGNAWVTAAKQFVASDAAGAAIDMPAGPSEVMVLADDGADPVTVAADLLSQAEHGPDSQVVLVTTDHALAERCSAAVTDQLATLPRQVIASHAIAASAAIVVDKRETALAIVNRYAPEHLIVHMCDPRSVLPAIRNAGSVFLGPWTPESVGDYCSGTNHVLPTYGYARAYSGLGVSDFCRSMTVQELTEDGLRRIGPTTVTLAEVEGLAAHARAVTLRIGSR